MDVTDFNNNFLNNLLKKKINEHQPTNEFLDSLASDSYLPYVIQPSQHTSHSRTLIDNIFSNVISKDIICGNITATISEHLPQFLVSPNTLICPPINLMFLKENGQNLTRKILSWIALI